jgi:hypothetical protein
MMDDKFKGFLLFCIAMVTVSFLGYSIPYLDYFSQTVLATVFFFQSNVFSFAMASS